MTTSLVRTRHATVDDVRAVLCLYERCSADTLERRFHVPVASVPERMVRQLVVPLGGWSLMAEQGEELVGHGCAGVLSRSTVEIALLVDDAFQGTGIGTRLMRDLAVSATERGFSSMVCSVEPDNESVLPTVRRAGLDCVSTFVDGVVELTIPLLDESRELQQPA